MATSVLFLGCKDKMFEMVAFIKKVTMFLYEKILNKTSIMVDNKLVVGGGIYPPPNANLALFAESRIL